MSPAGGGGESEDCLPSGVNNVPGLFCKQCSQFVPNHPYPQLAEVEIVGTAPRAVRNGAFGKYALH